VKFHSLEIRLRNTENKGEVLPLSFEIFKDNLSQRWAGALANILRDDLLLEKHYNFLGFAQAKRDLKDIAADINCQVEIINNFGWNGRYQILERADEDEKAGMHQEQLNALHNHFEILIGQVWNRAIWFTEAPHPTQVAILLLNNYIHEYEFKTRALEKSKRSQQKQASKISIAYTATPHYDLLPADYSRFSLHRTFGDLYLHYSQLGKTFEEAFNDQDEFIDDMNISALRYYTGECDVHLGEAGDYDGTCSYIEKLHSWLRKKGHDPKNEKLALGEIKVGELRRKGRLAGSSPEEIELLLGRSWEIERIALKKRLSIIGIGLGPSRKYPYPAKKTSQLMQVYFEKGSWR